MAVVGSATVQLIAKTGRFAAGMTRAGRTLGTLGRMAARVGRGIRRLAGSFLRIGSIIGGLAAGAFGLLIRQQLKAGDEIAKTADKLGIGTERLEAFAIAAQLAGSDLRTLDKGMIRMAVNMADAARGIGEAKETIEELGLDAAKVGALPIGEMYLEVMDAISRLPTATERVTATAEILGTRAVALLNMAQGGRKAIEDVEKEMGKLGTLFTRLDLRKIEMLNDAWLKMKTIIGAIGRAFAVHIAGPLHALVTKTLDWVIAMGGAQNIVSAIIGWVKNAAFAVAIAVDSVLRMVKRVFLAIRVDALKLVQDLIKVGWDFGIAMGLMMGKRGMDLVEFVKPAETLFRSMTRTIHEARNELADFVATAGRFGPKPFAPMEKALAVLFGWLRGFNTELGEMAQKSLDALRAWREGMTTEPPEVPKLPGMAAGGAAGRLEAIFQGSQKALRADVGRVAIPETIERVAKKRTRSQQKWHDELMAAMFKLHEQLTLTPIRL